MRGQDFKQWRERAGLSQEDVASVVSSKPRVSRSTISQIETNDLPVADEWLTQLVAFLNDRARQAETGAK